MNSNTLKDLATKFLNSLRTIARKNEELKNTRRIEKLRERALDRNQRDASDFGVKNEEE